MRERYGCNVRQGCAACAARGAERAWLAAAHRGAACLQSASTTYMRERYERGRSLASNYIEVAAAATGRAGVHLASCGPSCILLFELRVACILLFTFGDGHAPIRVRLLEANGLATKDVGTFYIFDDICRTGACGKVYTALPRC